jgi:putative ABC transport system ATP-binding protein/macrolide transport system ATP-binding/permease protein/lipoprotein-releasing system ATP-binding protein
VLLECQDLRKIYTVRRGRIPAVDGIDLGVSRGEFLAICGRSGSGKSTLLGMVGGLCRPSAGRVRLDGADLWSMRRGALAEFRARRVGFLFQFSGLLPNLRAIDNIALPALLAGVGYKPAYARARDLLGQVGLSDRWDAYAGELSGGQQRRVALARALANEPLILLADEPTNDLDEEAEREVLGLIRELHRLRNMTVIVVTHDPALARQADRIITLRNGKLASLALPEPAAATPSPQPVAPPPTPVEPEPAAASLAPAQPTVLGGGLGRFLVGFVGWSLLVAGMLWGLDFVTAQRQRQSIDEKQVEQKKAQELALQQLRADVEGVSYRPEGDYLVGIFLQSLDAQRPLYVLGPSVRVFVQSKGTWREMPAEAVGFAENNVRSVAGKEIFRIAFRVNLDHYDELLKGYMHVRITNVMIVGERSDATEDLFERTDDYYVYLRPQNVPEDEVRKRNGWKEGAHVPLWMGMPPH